jgi:hypothetical protein
MEILIKGKYAIAPTSLFIVAEQFDIGIDPKGEKGLFRSGTYSHARTVCGQSHFMIV